MGVTPHVLGVVLGFVAAIAVGGLAIRLYPRGMRTAPVLYLGVYSLTTLVGSAFFAIRDQVPVFDLFLVSSGADISKINADADARFYYLMLAPVLVVPLVGAFVARTIRFESPAASNSRALNFRAFCAVATVVFLYCLAMLVQAGAGRMLGSIAGDYWAAVEERHRIFGAAGDIALGMIYVGLPTLSFVALFEAAVRREKRWWLAWGAVSAAEVLLSVLTFQKSILLVFILLTMLAMHELRLARVSVFVLGSAVGLAVLTFMQAYVLVDPWGVVDSLSLLFFRLASAVPYYISVFPGEFPFVGVDWQGLMFGRVFYGEATHYAQTVFDFIYPIDVSARGSAPVNAVLSAYVEGGVVYATVMMVLVGLLVGGAARFAGRARSNALRFGLLLSLLSVVYYSTQVQLPAAIWLSYGIKWAVLTLVALSIAHRSAITSRVRFFISLAT